MPYTNYHAARIADPMGFKRLATKKLTEGVHLIGGPKTEGGPWTPQSYRFDRKKFTGAEALAWLKSHKVKGYKFEAASPVVTKEKSMDDVSNWVAGSNDDGIDFSAIADPVLWTEVVVAVEKGINIQRGPRGGKYYVASSGQKIYISDAQAAALQGGKAAPAKEPSGKRIKSENTVWGFHGTVASSAGGDAEGHAAEAFHEAAKRLMKMGMTEKAAVTMLDSRMGRHAADQVAGGTNTTAKSQKDMIDAIKAGKHDAALKTHAKWHGKQHPEAGKPGTAADKARDAALRRGHDITMARTAERQAKEKDNSRMIKHLAVLHKISEAGGSIKTPKKGSNRDVTMKALARKDLVETTNAGYRLTKKGRDAVAATPVEKSLDDISVAPQGLRTGEDEAGDTTYYGEGREFVRYVVKSLDAEVRVVRMVDQGAGMAEASILDRYEHEGGMDQAAATALAQGDAMSRACHLIEKGMCREDEPHIDATTIDDVAAWVQKGIDADEDEGVEAWIEKGGAVTGAAKKNELTQAEAMEIMTFRLGADAKRWLKSLRRLATKGVGKSYWPEYPYDGGSNSVAASVDETGATTIETPEEFASRCADSEVGSLFYSYEGTPKIQVMRKLGGPTQFRTWIHDTLVGAISAANAANPVPGLALKGAEEEAPGVAEGGAQ